MATAGSATTRELRVRGDGGSRCLLSGGLGARGLRQVLLQVVVEVVKLIDLLSPAAVVGRGLPGPGAVVGLMLIRSLGGELRSELGVGSCQSRWDGTVGSLGGELRAEGVGMEGGTWKAEWGRWGGRQSGHVSRRGELGARGGAAADQSRSSHLDRHEQATRLRQVHAVEGGGWRPGGLGDKQLARWHDAGARPPPRSGSRGLEAPKMTSWSTSV